MALIKCPECGKDVSDRALNCIHCGFPLAEAATVNEQYYRLIFTGRVKLGKNNLDAFGQYRHMITGSGEGVMDKFLHPPFDMFTGLTIDEAKTLSSYFYALNCKTEIREDNSNTGRNPMVGKIFTEGNVNLFCPKCGAVTISTGTRGFSIVTGFIGSGKTVNRCGSCGWKWTPNN